ncbi:MAG TPA: thiolase family protein [Solirubrobacterales bacterium]|nr:thiolase family protein [Solirubrobacterales bacterium]
MSDRWVNIVGAAYGRHDHRNDSLEELIYETTTEALADAGIELEQVDALVSAGSDQIDGRAITSMLSTGPAGGDLKDETNIASASAHALAMGWLMILSGQRDVVLVTSWGRASEGEVPAAEHLTADPFYDRDLPLEDLVAMAMQAQVHRTQVDGVDAAAAAVVEKNLANAVAAGRPVEAVGADAVRESPVVGTPLRELEVSPRCDGVVCIVLAAPGAVSTDRAVAIRGMGWASDRYRLADRDLVGLPHLQTASKAAFERAGISSVKDDVDFFELHDYSADAELLAAAAIGLTDVKSAPGLVLEGATAADGRWPVNLTGGSLAGDFPFGGPLARVAEATAYIRGEGPSKTNGSTGLVQMSAGFAGQFQTAVVLDRPEEA